MRRCHSCGFELKNQFQVLIGCFDTLGISWQRKLKISSVVESTKYGN